MIFPPFYKSEILFQLRFPPFYPPDGKKRFRTSNFGRNLSVLPIHIGNTANPGLKEQYRIIDSTPSPSAARIARASRRSRNEPPRNPSQGVHYRAVRGIAEQFNLGFMRSTIIACNHCFGERLSVIRSLTFRLYGE